jgi:hypothetical protein
MKPQLIEGFIFGAFAKLIGRVKLPPGRCYIRRKADGEWQEVGHTTAEIVMASGLEEGMAILVIEETR